MEYVYIPREEDRNIILDYKEKFEPDGNQKLVDSYNREAKMGILGVHRQGLYLIALHLEFIERFDKSPLGIKDSISIALKGPIKYVEHDDTFVFVG